MNRKPLIRFALVVAFGFVGSYVARSGTPPEIFALSGIYLMLAAVIAFGTLGFILPDILELAWKTGISAVARQIADVVPGNRRMRFRHKKVKYPQYVNPLLVDTSCLIDGRLQEVVETGFLFGTLLVMPSVIDELHKLADNANDLKRAKGRRGLDFLASLKKSRKVKVEILKNEPKEGGVDSKLVSLAKKIHARVLTVDFNLNKVASVQNVGVLNINELANAVKTAVLPKDRLDITISAKGREKGQGVGYLQDGTMVVVEDGVLLEGKNVEVEVKRVLQTAAGKMIFAKRSKI